MRSIFLGFVTFIASTTGFAAIDKFNCETVKEDVRTFGGIC